MTTSPANTTPVLSQEAADAFVQSGNSGYYTGNVEDYEFDAETGRHLYFFDNGESVLAVFANEDGSIAELMLDATEGTDPTPTAPAAPVLSDIAQDRLFDDAVAALNKTGHVGRFFTADYSIDLATGNVTFSLKDGGNVSVDVNGVVTEWTFEDRAIAAALARLDEAQAKQIFNSYWEEETGDVTFFLMSGGMVAIDKDGAVVIDVEAEGDLQAIPSPREQIVAAEMEPVEFYESLPSPQPEQAKVAARRAIQQELNFLNEREAEMRQSADRNADGWSLLTVAGYRQALAEIDAERKALNQQMKATYN